MFCLQLRRNKWIVFFFFDFFCDLINTIHITSIMVRGFSACPHVKFDGMRKHGIISNIRKLLPISKVRNLLSNNRRLVDTQFACKMDFVSVNKSVNIMLCTIDYYVAKLQVLHEFETWVHLIKCFLKCINMTIRVEPVSLISNLQLWHASCL